MSGHGYDILTSSELFLHGQLMNGMGKTMINLYKDDGIMAVSRPIMIIMIYVAQWVFHGFT